MAMKLFAYNIWRLRAKYFSEVFDDSELHQDQDGYNNRNQGCCRHLRKTKRQSISENVLNSE